MGLSTKGLHHWQIKQGIRKDQKEKKAKKSIEGPDEGKIRETIFLACEVLKLRYEEIIKLKSEDGKRQKGKENPPAVIIYRWIGNTYLQSMPKGYSKRWAEVS